MSSLQSAPIRRTQEGSSSLQTGHGCLASEPLVSSDIAQTHPVRAGVMRWNPLLETVLEVAERPRTETESEAETSWNSGTLETEGNPQSGRGDPAFRYSRFLWCGESVEPVSGSNRESRHLIIWDHGVDNASLRDVWLFACCGQKTVGPPNRQSPPTLCVTDRASTEMEPSHNIKTPPTR